VAIAGLLLAPGAAPVVWALLDGLGTGAAFPLAMTLVTGTWTAGLVLLFAVLLVQAAIGLAAARPRLVGADA
jgi:CP family cyanate transporter-like MFS transporter